MGYYSHFYYQINYAKVDKEKAKQFESFFADDKNANILYGFTDVKLNISNDNKLCGIQLLDDEYFGKFYDGELFARKLSEILISGSVLLYFIGEDGCFWGYLVEPNKVLNVFPAVSYMKDGVKHYKEIVT